MFNIFTPMNIRVIAFCFNFIFVAAFYQKGFARPPGGVKKVVYIRIKLNSAAPVKANIAPLKYNKHLAFSFTLDDGYRSAYLCAFPLLNGGRVSPPLPDEWRNDEGGDGNYYKGLFYTDGCGRAVPFKLGLAINAAFIADTPQNRGHLSWAEVKTMYNAGWDILNHSYRHATLPGTDYDAEVVQNVKTVQQRLGFTMTQFVIPGGNGDSNYQQQYVKAAFKSGSVAAAYSTPVATKIGVDTPVNLSGMIYSRGFIGNPQNTVDLNIIEPHLRMLDSLMKQPKPVWYNEFTHGAGNTNLWTLSLFFPEFKYYMTDIAATYGAGGSDNIWMAPWQEVYEYIWLRDRTKIIVSQKGREVTIKLELPNLPGYFRHAALSVNLKTKSGFEVVAHSAGLQTDNNGHSLLNIILK